MWSFGESEGEFVGSDPCSSDPSTELFEMKLVIEMHSSKVDRIVSQVVEINRLRDLTLFNSSVFDSATVFISFFRTEI